MRRSHVANALCVRFGPLRQQQRKRRIVAVFKRLRLRMMI